jgi:hypothetical protein
LVASFQNDGSGPARADDRTNDSALDPTTGLIVLFFDRAFVINPNRFPPRRANVLVFASDPSAIDRTIEIRAQALGVDLDSANEILHLLIGGAGGSLLRRLGHTGAQYRPCCSKALMLSHPMCPIVHSRRTVGRV